jgi:hypothetical protein
LQALQFFVGFPALSVGVGHNTRLRVLKISSGDAVDGDKI